MLIWAFAPSFNTLHLAMYPPALQITNCVVVIVQVIGECHRRWHLWRRNYDVYLGNKQFAAVENPGFWHWTFTLKDHNQGRLAEIDRNWRGFGYEFLTDAGQYMIRFGDVLPRSRFQYTAHDETLHNHKPLLSTKQTHSGLQEMQQLRAAAEEVDLTCSLYVVVHCFLHL
jgi:hypothetical protein